MGCGSPYFLLVILITSMLGHVCDCEEENGTNKFVDEEKISGKS
jgi:hypothetical protein